MIADRQDKRREGTEGRKQVGITAAHQPSEDITDALVAVEDEILLTPSTMSAHDEEYPLDSLLEKEEQESAGRRWPVRLISVIGLAAFVGFAWYVYKPTLDSIPDPSIPAVFASTAPVAPVAKIVTSTGDFGIGPEEAWVAAPIEDPAALHTNSGKVDNLSIASLTQPRLLRLRTPFMRGPDVTALQQALAAKDIAIDVDGVYGSATEAAVIAFQEHEGLTPNGIIGPDTRSRLR